MQPANTKMQKTRRVLSQNKFRDFLIIGISSERRNAEIKRLNQTYLDVVNTKKELKASLHHMVDTESYRWICKATYSLDPQPIRSQRLFQSETTVPDSVRNIIMTPSYWRKIVDDAILDNIIMT